MIYLLTSGGQRCLIGKLKGNKVSRSRPRAASMSARWEGKIMRQPLVFFAALGIALGVTAANAAYKPMVGIITKTNTNPFFVNMKAGDADAATAHSIQLRSFAGEVAVDNDGPGSA